MKLTPEQLEAVTAYAAWAGVDWHSQLVIDWQRGGSRWSGDYHILQKLRNTHGIKWLRRFNLPEKEDE